MQLVLFVGLALTVHFLRKVSQVEAPQSGHQGRTKGTKWEEPGFPGRRDGFFCTEKKLEVHNWFTCFLSSSTFAEFQHQHDFTKDFGAYILQTTLSCFGCTVQDNSRPFFAGRGKTGQYFSLIWWGRVGWVVGGGGEGWAINAHVHMHTILTLRCWDLAGTCIQQGGWSGEWGGGVGY